ncbi:MAG: HU family DNA-binding protein [Gammaproteobacteria bacterium]
MRKRLFIKALRAKFPDLPPAAVARMTDKIFEMIIETLREGGKIEIRKFGTFYTAELGRRLLRNPGTGDMMEVPARRLPRFKPSRELREKANRGG